MMYRFCKEDPSVYTRSQILNVLHEKFWKLRHCELMPDRLEKILNEMVLDGVVVPVGGNDDRKMQVN